MKIYVVVQTVESYEFKKLVYASSSRKEANKEVRRRNASMRFRGNVEVCSVDLNEKEEAE